MVTKLWSLGRVKLLTNNGDRLVVRSPEKTALYHCFKRVRNWLGNPEFLKGRGHIGDTIRCFLLLLLAGVYCEPSSRSPGSRSEEHTSELQSRGHLVCRLLLEKKKYTK